MKQIINFNECLIRLLNLEKKKILDEWRRRFFLSKRLTYRRFYELLLCALLILGYLFNKNTILLYKLSVLCLEALAFVEKRCTMLANSDNVIGLRPVTFLALCIILSSMVNPIILVIFIHFLALIWLLVEHPAYFMAVGWRNGELIAIWLAVHIMLLTGNHALCSEIRHLEGILAHRQFLPSH